METKPMPEEWYKITTANHFFFQWRWRAFIHAAKKCGLLPSTRLKTLDIGCGHGLLMQQVERHTKWEIDGVDIQSTGFQYAQVTGNLYDFDITMPPDKHFIAKYDMAILFDVLEHLESPKDFVGSALQYVAPGGFICVNVPALPALWSRFDTAVGHLKRYTKSAIAEVLDNNDLELLRVDYWGMTCVPLLMARKLYTLTAVSTEDLVTKGVKPPNEWINNTLNSIGSLETALISSPPLGTSVMAIAQKKKDC